MYREESPFIVRISPPKYMYLILLEVSFFLHPAAMIIKSIIARVDRFLVDFFETTVLYKSKIRI